MTEHGDQIRSAFESHEHLAPDAEATYAKVRELSRTYVLRRRGAQVAGGAVLGAGLIAGGIGVPALLHTGSDSGTVAVAPAAPAASPAAPVKKPVVSEQQKDWDAYFNAGYNYDDAVKLAKLWHSKANIGDVKAQAGAKLLAGEALPFKPSPAHIQQAKDNKAIEAFYLAHYSDSDAVRLGKLWHESADKAKIAAGNKLLAGETLPIKPGPIVLTPAQKAFQAQLAAFFKAGYDYNDAVKLAKLWKLGDNTDSAKAEAGKKLLAGETLPIRP